MVVISFQFLKSPRLLFLSILALGLLACSPSSPTSSDVTPAKPKDSRYSSVYDEVFKESAGKYLYPPYDWRWLKAQCYQESLLIPNAISPVGAKGLCQFMDGTWSDVTEKLRLRASPYDPKASIMAAGFYMRELLRAWKSPRPELDRLKFAQASYNAGFGNILKFQSYCQGAILWKQVFPCIRFEETRNYVILIEKHYRNLGGRVE